MKVDGKLVLNQIGMARNRTTKLKSISPYTRFHKYQVRRPWV